MNVNGVIYLWDEKSLRTKDSFFPAPNYMGELFEQMVSGRVPPNAEIIDAYEKVGVWCCNFTIRDQVQEMQ